MSFRTWMLLGLIAAPAWALPPLSLSLGYSAQVFTSRSFDLVASADHLQMFRVGIGYSLPVPRGTLDLEVAFSTGGTQDFAHGTVPVQFGLFGVEAGGSWRYPLLAHFEPYVHLGAGWDWASLTIVDQTRLTQTVSNISGSAMLGAQVPFKLGPDDSHAPWLLLDLGVGYILRPGASFHAMAPAQASPTPEDPIAHATTNLGTLPLSGIQYRVLLTLRF